MLELMQLVQSEGQPAEKRQEVAAGVWGEGGRSMPQWVVTL